MNRAHTQLAAFRRWQSDAVAAACFECTPIGFGASQAWAFDAGILRHRSGGFFSLAGIEAWAREGALHQHQQLIILQPQVSINGFLLQRREGRPQLLFHGRLEPGNVGGMQLAPTVQSTPANYQRVHHGRPTPFVEYFLDPARGETLVDVLQSEEGNRYHGKYNRNVVVRLPEQEQLELPPQFRWYDLEAIGQFARADNVLNTDARSVLACLDWQWLAGAAPVFAGGANGGLAASLARSLDATEDADHSHRAVFEWLSRLRARLGLRTRILPIDELGNWVCEDAGIREREPRLRFAARQYRVVAHGREVDEWDQPLIDTDGRGRLALVCQERGGTLKFLMRASREIGFLEGVQLGPSIHVPPERRGASDDPVESALLEHAVDAARCEVLQRCRESEEGGRFFQDENDYELLRLAPGLTLPASDDYRWMSLGQIRELIGISGLFSMEFRGVLSLLLGHAS